MSPPRAPQHILEEITARGARRVKIGVTDIDGLLRGKYLGADKLESLSKTGAGFCDCVFGWDMHDVLYDNVEFSSWKKGFPDTNYRVDLNTLRWLPDGERGTPFFLGELIPLEGEAFHPVCPRNLAKRVFTAAERMGFGVRAAFEYEYFLFDETAESVREKGYRNLKPFTPGMAGYSVLRTGVHAELHHDFMDYCDELDMPLEGFHTETGPGVLEAAIRVAPGLDAFDRAVLFKTFSKIFYQDRGLLPTFMAKWSMDYPGQSGHLHLSLVNAAGEPLFQDPTGPHSMSATMQHFVAGLVTYLPELCAMISPTVNSYTRLVKGAWAPTTATWGADNRTVALRVIPGKPAAQRVEVRQSAADGNPYIVGAAALAAGLEGIARKLVLPPETSGNAYEHQESLPAAQQLPGTLRAAALRLKESAMARAWFGDAFVDHFVNTRLWESREYERSVTDWELRRYLELI